MIRTYTKILTTLLVALFMTAGAIAQSDGDYRTQASGDWSDIATWEVYNSTSVAWEAASIAPDGTGNIIILDGDSVNVATGTVEILGNLTVEGTSAPPFTGGKLTADGGTLIFANGSVYQHDRDEGAIPMASWNTGSTASFTGLVTGEPDNMDQAFHDVVYENASQIENISFGWNDYTLNGDLTVLNTNGNQFRLSSAGDEGDPAREITIMGNLTVDGENAEFTSTGSGDIFNYNIEVMGDVSVINGGFLSTSRGSGGAAVWTLHGDLTVTDGKLGESNIDKHGQRRSFVFAGSTPQSITGSNVDTESTLYYEIAAGSEVTVATGSFPMDSLTVSGDLTLEGELEAAGPVVLDGAGTMTVADGGTYNHAYDAGEVPSADWQTGSTIVFSGLLGDAPENRAQAYHNVVWNNPGQVSNLDLGLGTVTITGDVRVVDTGGSRFRLTSSGDGDGETITIEGDVLVEGGAIETTGSSSTATYNVVVNGNVMVYSGTTFATSRGSGGKATWTVGGDFAVMGDATLRDSNDADSSRVVFAGSTTQNISISADAGYNGAFNFTVSGSDVVVPADSMFHFEDDFSVDGALTVNGTISARDTLKVDGGTLTVADGGVYNHDYDSGEIPTATWATGSTVWLTGIETSDPDNGDQDFFNYTWDNAGQIENINIGWNDYTLAGSMTVLNTNGNQFRLSSAGDEGDPARMITIMGDVVVDGENAEFTATGSGDIFDYDITVMGDVSIVNGGFLSASRGSGGRAVWTLYGDMTIDGGEIGDSDTDKHGQFRTFVFAADTASDGVPGQTITANDVSYDSDVYFEVADSSGIMLAAGSDWTYEGIFTNYGVFDVDAGATLTFADGATYDHARDGGDVPTATWAEGSTASFTGMVTSGPGNANQDFFNLVIDAPGNIENNDFGMRDNTIYGDIDVVTTGSARAYLSNPDSFDTLEVSIMGDITMQQGAFASNGTGSGATHITINHYGSINVADGNFSISRGSGPIVEWYMYEGDFSMQAGKTQNSNARAGSAFIFAGEDLVQHMDVSADVDMSNLPVRIDSGAYLDVGTTSFQPNGDNFTLNAGGTLAVADTAGFDTNFELAGSGETVLSLSSDAHYVLNGTEHQQTGFYLPISVASLTIDNEAGVTQSRPITVTDYLRLANGLFDNTPGITLGAEAEVIVENGRTVVPMDGVPGPPSTDEIVWNFENSADINSWVNGTNSAQTLMGSADATQGDSSLSWEYTVDPSEDWGGSADIELLYGDFLTDLTEYDGFSFDYKTLTPADPSDGGAYLNVKVYVASTSGVEQYHYMVPNVLSDASGEWQTANVFFEDLAIPSWSDTFDGVLYADMITKIEMQVFIGSNGSETSGQILVDNMVPATAPLPIPEPPYAIGDIVNYNGSFATAELGASEAEAWLIEGVSTSSAEIVADAADDDERALMFDVVHEGENWYASQAVNEPINVVEGDRYRASIHMKADEAGRLVQFYVGMDDRGGWERVRGSETPQLDLTTEWAEYAFEFDATAAHETNQLRMAVEFNAADNDGGTLYFDNAVMEKIEATSNESLDELPNEFALNQNYPNPFNPTTNISYDLPEASDVNIKIYDITGREVAELINTRQSAGTHNIEWNAQQFATGVYLYRIQAGDFTAVRKLTLIK